MSGVLELLIALERSQNPGVAEARLKMSLVDLLSRKARCVGGGENQGGAQVGRFFIVIVGLKLCNLLA